MRKILVVAMAVCFAMSAAAGYAADEKAKAPAAPAKAAPAAGTAVAPAAGPRVEELTILKERIANLPKRKFRSESVEFVSLGETGAQGRKMKVKAADGSTLELNVPPYVRVTKFMELTELKSGEKVDVRFTESDEAKTVSSVRIGAPARPALMRPMATPAAGAKAPAPTPAKPAK